jgi:hypothetical protein
MTKRRLDPADAVTMSAQPSPINGPMPNVSESFSRIVERVFDIGDPDALFTTLMERMSLRDALTPGALQASLNIAEDNARLAHQLYVNAKVESERFEIDSDIVLGAMRAGATAELQREKDAGQRSKAITDADVREKAATLYPDQWRETNERRAKTSGMLEHLKRLADLWQTRCYSLSTMLNAGKR